MPFKEITNLKLELSKNTDSSSANLLLREVSRTRLNQRAEPCKDYGDNFEFNNCAKKYLQSAIKLNATCYLPGKLKAKRSTSGQSRIKTFSYLFSNERFLHGQPWASRL
jgi:hypothetical protein